MSAFIVPVKRDGQTTGYMSRTPASRADIRTAEALYAKRARRQLPRQRRLPTLTDAKVNLAAIAVFNLLLLTLAVQHGQWSDGWRWRWA